jgi:hypothetical protein
MSHLIPKKKIKERSMNIKIEITSEFPHQQRVIEEMS